MVTYILATVAAALIIAADRLTKCYISANYVLGESHKFIPKLIDITYVQNTGAAWGMLNDRTWLLISVTTVVMLICVALILKYGTKNKLLFWAITLVLSGGIGNMIDRVFYGGKVVDFLHFEFWPQFPVFNIADCAITVGAGLLVIYFIMDICRDQKAKGHGRAKPDTNDENA
ncbi:MAG: signal peptidase II [Clostridia bacterium]|nr:signal peptidase II [Clostridia bacterium]